MRRCCLRKDLKVGSRESTFPAERDSKCKDNDAVMEGQDAKSGMEQAGTGETVAGTSQPSII